MFASEDSLDIPMCNRSFLESVLAGPAVESALIAHDCITRVSLHGARVAALLAPARGHEPPPWVGPVAALQPALDRPTPRPMAPAPAVQVKRREASRAASAKREASEAIAPVASEARKVARWPVVACGLVACIMSAGALLRSPLAQAPAVRPGAVVVERGLSRGHAALEQAFAIAKQELDDRLHD